MGKPPFLHRQIPPTPKLVDQFFNDSTGQGEDGEIDVRVLGTKAEEWEFVESPAIQELRNSPNGDGVTINNRSTSTTAAPALVQELLVEELQDLLHAEGQLVKGLPKMIEASKDSRLKFCFEVHLEETKAQVDRLKNAFDMLAVKAKGKPCRGMAGLLEEGDEIIAEGEQKEPIASDLALIASGQKVEHYEISSYGTARTLAQQMVGQTWRRCSVSHLRKRKPPTICSPRLRENSCRKLEPVTASSQNSFNSRMSKRKKLNS